MEHGAEFVDSRNNVPLNQSEDVGESVERNISSNPTRVRTDPVLAFEIVTGSEHSRDVEKRLHEREGPGLDAAEPVECETVFRQPEAGASIPGFESYASSAPVERQKQRRSVNAIDDLFGLF